MKKIIIMTMLIGTLTTALTSCSVRFGIESRKNTGNVDNLSKSISIDNIDDIDISIGAASIIINEIEGNDVTVDFVAKSNLSEKTTVEKQNNTIVIRERQYKSGWVNGKNAFADRKVTIGIPSSYLNNIALEYGAGNVIVDDINVSELDIEGGAGNLEINNIVFSSLDLKQGVGNTDIDLEEKCGDIKIEGGVGNLSLRIGEVGGDLSCEGGVGDTEIYVPDQSPIKIKTSSGIGKSNINVNTSGENIYDFDLEIGIGNLSVN